MHVLNGSCYVMVEQSAGALCGSRQNLNTGGAFPLWPGFRISVKVYLLD